MSDSAPLNRQLMGEVGELIDIFPYFQSAHLLLLKGLKSNADVKFENQLRISAIHIADREVLYYYLQKKVSVITAAAEIRTEKLPATDTFSDTQQTVIESAKNSTDLINEIEHSSGSNEQNETQDRSDHPSGHSILIQSEADEEESAGVMTLMDEEPLPGEEKIFFMDPGFTVPENDDADPGFTVHENDDLLELDLDEDMEDGSTMTSTVPEMSGRNENDSKKRMQSVLIDKFITANPRIEPVREKPDLPLLETNKHLVEAEGGFVTETLAKIYISQEYYSKAIDIYEKLCLKFPEKSSYFASQIEKVKEYIKK
jgi:hypothetical protein